MAIRPILVMGSPRSGTTLIGNYIGSSPYICNLGEYAGFYFTLRVAVREYSRMPAIFKERYLHEIQRHAVAFPINIAREFGCCAYCESAPWNLLVLDDLVELLPNALFILTLRHYRGVIQSLQRSYLLGYKWAGADIEASARLWAKFYSNVSQLPSDRTIVIGYEMLCRQPHKALDELHEQLMSNGIDPLLLDSRVLCESHANPPEARRPTIGTMRADGSFFFHGRATFRPEDWSSEMEEQVLPVVQSVNNDLDSRYADIYEDPLPE